MIQPDMPLFTSYVAQDISACKYDDDVPEMLPHGERSAYSGAAIEGGRGSHGIIAVRIK